MKHLMIPTMALALAALGSAAAAQDAAPLTIDDSLICAGVFYAQSTLPENAGYAEGVENYRSMTRTFLTRAEILAGREGKNTDGHIERAAEVADLLIGRVNAAGDASARLTEINSWQSLEQTCIEGGMKPA